MLDLPQQNQMNPFRLASPEVRFQVLSWLLHVLEMLKWVDIWKEGLIGLSESQNVFQKVSVKAPVNQNVIEIFPSVGDLAKKIESICTWNTFCEAYKNLLDVIQKLRWPIIHQKHPMISKFENIFQIMIDLWFILMSA